MAYKPNSRILFLNSYDFSLIAAFFLLFTLLTPLGIYKQSIPKKTHIGNYSIINLDPGDDTAYYSYLRSTFFDGDIDFFNEKKYAHFDRILSTGYVFNHWSIGPAIFWTPFFILGHLSALSLVAIGFKIPLDGYSFPYYISTTIGSTLFSFGGIFLLSRLLCKFFEKKIAYLSSFFVFASTALVYFTFIRQRMSHSLEFLLIVLFLFLFIKARESQYQYKWMALWGISIGALSLTRYNDITFLIIPGLDFCHALFIRWKKKDIRFDILKAYSLFVATFIITIVPLLIVWLILNGKPFPGSWTNYPSHFFTFNVFLVLKKFTHFFLGNDWGVLISEPIWLIALPGLWFFYKK